MLRRSLDDQPGSAEIGLSLCWSVDMVARPTNPLEIGVFREKTPPPQRLKNAPKPFVTPINGAV